MRQTSTSLEVNVNSINLDLGYCELSRNLSVMNQQNPLKDEAIISEDRVLYRYRIIMALIGVFYPAWRYFAYYFQPNENESWEQRGMIGVFFLTFTLLTYIHPYFKRNVSTYFNIIVYTWFVQVFYLMWVNDMSDQYLLMGFVTIFCVGGTFLSQNGLLGYYLLCIILTGFSVIWHPDHRILSFFWGVILALTISYACFKTMMSVFSELRISQGKLAKRNQEFEDLSAAVQSLFLPVESTVAKDGFSLSGYYRPAENCGGDWWSFFSENKDTLSVFVGDVTGHGPGSAMMTASISAYLKALQHTQSDRSIPEVLQRLNSYIRELQINRTSSERYLMTILGVELDLKTRKLKLWSAGTPWPIILRKDGNVELIGQVGSPIGLAEELKLGFETTDLSLGDRLFLYTDGILEMKISADQMLGERKLGKLLQDTKDMSPSSAIAALAIKLDELRLKKSEQEDDFTFVILDAA
jgi:serine phosphatase RsbU (regulator of sigma subunit)